MLIVAGEVVVEAGTIEKVKAALHETEEASRKEPGCISYAFSVDVNDPTMVRIFERWNSAEDLKAHFAMPHMASFGTAVSQIQPKSMDVKVYEIDKEIPLPR